jgi:hypothetical protein
MQITDILSISWFIMFWFGLKVISAWTVAAIIVYIPIIIIRLLTEIK